MKTTIFENSEFHNGKSETAKYLYKLCPENKYKKLRKFAINMEIGIYAMNCSGDNFYWCNGMTGGGNWERGGFFPFPICNKPSELIVDRSQNEVWKFVKKLNN